MYPLNLVGWLGLQVIEHVKALAGTVNTAHFVLIQLIFSRTEHTSCFKTSFQSLLRSSSGLTTT